MWVVFIVRGNAPADIQKPCSIRSFLLTPISLGFRYFSFTDFGIIALQAWPKILSLNLWTIWINDVCGMKCDWTLNWREEGKEWRGVQFECWVCIWMLTPHTERWYLLSPISRSTNTAYCWPQELLLPLDLIKLFNEWVLRQDERADQLSSSSIPSYWRLRLLQYAQHLHYPWIAVTQGRLSQRPQLRLARNRLIKVKHFFARWRWWRLVIKVANCSSKRTY